MRMKGGVNLMAGSMWEGDDGRSGAEAVTARLDGGANEAAISFMGSFRIDLIRSAAFGRRWETKATGEYMSVCFFLHLWS